MTGSAARSRWVTALWVGAPGEDLGAATDAGVATQFLTAPLRTAGSVQYQQGSRKVPGAPEKGDRFGAALAGGGAMIGAPGEDVGRIVDAGAVIGQLRYALTQDSEGVPGSAEAGDQFGAALAMSAKQWERDTEVTGTPSTTLASEHPGRMLDPPRTPA